MILIDEEKCGGCGLCVEVCHEHCLTLANGAPHVDHVYCSTCTQCIAICTQRATSWNGTPAQAYDRARLPTPAQIDELLKGRRSMRQFKEQKISRPLLEEIVGYGIYAPTNNYHLRAIVVDDAAMIAALDQIVVGFSAPSTAGPGAARAHLRHGAAGLPGGQVFQQGERQGAAHPVERRGGPEERMTDVRVITLPLPFGLGTVNCYLVETDGGSVLIDTGSSNRRAGLEEELTRAGCEPGDLDLILLTHGDFDHTGNAAYLRAKYGAQIAMHRGDLGMAERGDMFSNRSSGNALLRLLAPLLFRFSKANRFTPDVYVEDGDDLSEYGFDAQVLSIPGHSAGSIALLTADGRLFCGDLLENVGEPATNAIMDDRAACGASLEKLRALEIDIVYPGHGEPFAMDAFWTRQGRRDGQA